MTCHWFTRIDVVIAGLITLSKVELCFYSVLAIHDGKNFYFLAIAHTYSHYFVIQLLFC